MRYEKVRFQWPNAPFLIVIYHSSLVKDDMRAFVNCAMVSKNASISSFFTGQRRNKDHRALVNCGMKEKNFIQCAMNILRSYLN
jgi:hypothetical protein